MWGKSLLLFGILFFSQIAVAGDLQEGKVSSAVKKIEFEPKYKTSLLNLKQTYSETNDLSKGIEELDRTRILRIKREYSIDWYYKYCGDPRDNSEREDFKCRFKLENLTEQEERSLLVFKTNFLDSWNSIDPRLNKKVLEIINDVRDNEDKGKYGRQSKFVYSPDVMLGIILMEQSLEVLAEYKWAYAKVRYLYDREEFRNIRDSLSSRERNLRIIESKYERERLLLLQSRHNFDLINDRCGDEDYTGYFEAYGEIDERDYHVPDCIQEYANKIYTAKGDYREYTLCTCSPKLSSFVEDLSLADIASVLVAHYNEIYSDARNDVVENGIFLDIIGKKDKLSAKESKVVNLYFMKDVLLGRLISTNNDYYTGRLKTDHLLLISYKYESQIRYQGEKEL